MLRSRPTPPARRQLLPLCAALLALSGAACGGRTVQVSTGEAAPAESSVILENALDQAVNVYVRPAGGSEIFLRQVPGRSTETIPVRGLAGQQVTLRAAPVDGRQSYSRADVTITRGTTWRVP